MTWDDKNKIPQTTKIVVTVSNWHFNRDTLKQEKAPECKLENVMVALKLSSTVFESTESGANSRSASEATAGEEDAASCSGSPGSTGLTSKSGETYHFDKNGAVIPYSAFVALFDNEPFQEYLSAVKALLKSHRKEGSTASSSSSSSKLVASAEPETTAQGDEAEVLDDSEIEEPKKSRLAKKRRGEAARKMKYGRARKNINFEEDDAEPPQSSQAPRPTATLFHDEDDEYYGLSPDDCNAEEKNKKKVTTRKDGKEVVEAENSEAKKEDKQSSKTPKK
jgi:hypothetical protein